MGRIRLLYRCTRTYTHSSVPTVHVQYTGKASTVCTVCTYLTPYIDVHSEGIKILQQTEAKSNSGFDCSLLPIPICNQVIENVHTVLSLRASQSISLKIVLLVVVVVSVVILCENVLIHLNKHLL